MFTKIKQYFKDMCSEMCFSKQMKNIFLQSAIILAFVFLSIFWKGFSLIALIATIVSVALNRNGKCVYFLFLLLPFVSIFKINTNDFYLLPIVVAVIIIMLGVALLIKLIKKQEKLNLPLTVVMAVFIVYLIIGLKLSNLSAFLSLVLGIALLYVIYYFRNDISLKEMAYMFALGMLISVFVGLFRPVNARLQLMITQYYAFDLVRFSACAENVNVFAGELSILLSVFTGLYLKKQIKHSYYIIYFLSFYLLTLTMSKSTFIIFIFITFALIVHAIIIHKKSCYKEILIILGCLLLAFILNPVRNYLYIYRLLGNGDIISTKGMSNLTTGRLDIWLVYFGAIFSSLKNCMFGFGISADPIGMFSSIENCNAHNTFIQMWYHSGVVGILLFLCMLCTYVGWKRVFRLRFSIFVVLLSVILFLMGLDFFSYRFSNYFILIFFTYEMFKDEQLTSINKTDKKEIKIENASNNNADIQQG